MMLSKQIAKRKRQEALLQVAIVSNPHTKNPKELIKELSEPEEESNPLDTTYDKEGMDRLKQVMAQGKAFKVR